MPPDLRVMPKAPKHKGLLILTIVIAVLLLVVYIIMKVFPGFFITGNRNTPPELTTAQRQAIVDQLQDISYPPELTTPQRQAIVDEVEPTPPPQELTPEQRQAILDRLK